LAKKLLVTNKNSSILMKLYLCWNSLHRIDSGSSER